MGRFIPPRTTAVCGLLSALLVIGGWCLWRTHEREMKIEHFRQLGGRVETRPTGPDWFYRLVLATIGQDGASGLKDITVIDLSYLHIHDHRLENLNGLDQLEELHLESTEVTDAGLVHLHGLKSLKRLYLGNSRVTDSGLQALYELKGLELLHLANTEVTDAGITDIESRLPNLEVVR